MHQAEDVADVQGLDQLLHPLAHGLGRAGDDVAAVDQVLPGELGIVARRGRRELRQRAGLDGLDRAVARRVGEARIDVQAAVVEVADVRAVEPLGLVVGVGDADRLGEAGAVGRFVDLRSATRSQ